MKHSSGKKEPWYEEKPISLRRRLGRLINQLHLLQKHTLNTNTLYLDTNVLYFRTLSAKEAPIYFCKSSASILVDGLFLKPNIGKLLNSASDPSCRD